jgi:hypothetical protein
VETPVLQPIPVRSTPIYHAPQLAWHALCTRIANELYLKD